MKIISNIFFLVAVLLVFDSCTITKRHFGSGYHVEWNKKWKENEAASVAEKQDAPSDTLYAQATPVSKPDSDKLPSKKEPKVVVIETVSEKEGVTENLTVGETGIAEKTVQDGITSGDETVQEQVKTATAADDQPTDAAPKKKVEPLTWVAFAFLLAGIGFGFLPLSLFSSFALPLILFFLFFLIAFINAVSSAIRIKRNPEKYKAKGFTWLVLVLSSICFVYALTTLLLYMIKGSVLSFG
ncbi:hypothetical protein [Fluviicola sp.]|uniref:hypothetical protein n=1 Tax=Fluviicola sp. TaxID=1917219 RepID=UPI0031D48112